jgi:hypothetical protein
MAADVQDLISLAAGSMHASKYCTNYGCRRMADAFASDLLALLND